MVVFNVYDKNRNRKEHCIFNQNDENSVKNNRTFVYQKYNISATFRALVIKIVPY